MSKFIVFSGIDSAGKSTQIELIKVEYFKLKQKCFVFWSRGGYTPGFQKFKNLLRIFLGNKLAKPGNTPQRRKVLSNSFFRKLWLIIAILDLIYYYCIYLRFMKLRNFNIICDRYLMDTLIDFNIAYPNEKIEDWILWKLLNYTSLKPDVHFILAISVVESKKRSLKKNEPFPDSSKDLSLRLNNYIDYAKSNDKVDFIWCEKSVKIVNDEIITKLNKHGILDDY